MAGRDDIAVRQRSKQGAEDLSSKLKLNPGLDDLVSNPLLLTMIAQVHFYRAALPGSRVDLYREICLVCLGRRQIAKGMSTELLPEEKERILRVLALAMMRRRTRDTSADDANREIRSVLRRVSTSMSVPEFLRVIETESGLLVESEPGLYAFAHFTFQEYLAAVEIKESGARALLQQNVKDGWWRETTLLFSAQSDSTAIVRTCIDQGTSVTALSLASDCLDEGRDLALSLRSKLNAKLDELAASNDTSTRALAIGFQLDSLLRPTSRLNRNSLLCINPISNAMYQSFVRDDVPDYPFR